MKAVMHQVDSVKAPARNLLVNADLWLAVVGCGLLFLPTYVRLEQTIWNIVGQGHGPVMLALTLWLAWQRLPALLALKEVQRDRLGWVLLVVGALLYVVGRSQDILMFEVGAQIWILAGLLLLYWGRRGLRLVWFPLFFMIFLLPLPSPVVDALTSPLKSAVSYVAEELLYMAGYPVARAGVTLVIGQYKLLVADACAGLNSVFALEAIGVFYLSIMQYQSKARNIILAIAVLPISFVSNVIRVIALVLITYYFGDEVAQGYVHDFAGILLFSVATVLTIAFDALVGRLFFRNSENSPRAA